MRNRSHSVRERLADRLFDSGGWSSRSNNLNTSREPRLINPTANVAENKDHYLLEVAVPGYRKEDLKVEVQNNLLTVSGKAKKDMVSDETNLLRYEHRIREFKRSFELDADIDPKKVEATYDAGILKIKLNNKNGKISLAPAKINVQIQ